MKKKLTKTISIILTLIMCSIPTFAHSGRTDSSGGHRDNKNASGLGSYHYHHGYPAHLHPDGVCPYSSSVSDETETDSQSNSESTNNYTYTSGAYSNNDADYSDTNTESSETDVDYSESKEDNSDNAEEQTEQRNSYTGLIFIIIAVLCIIPLFIKFVVPRISDYINKKRYK